MFSTQVRQTSGVLILVTGLAACQSPFLVFSGGALSGPVIEIDSFSFAREFKLLRLEVRPEDAYSIILRVTVIDDQLYIDAAERRRWHGYLKRDNRIRVALGGLVYPATAVRVDDSDINRRFFRGRTVYRIVPRRS